MRNHRERSLRLALALSLPAALAILDAATPARADVLPPENAACDSSKVGEACTVATAGGSLTGTCQNSTCTSAEKCRLADGPCDPSFACLSCNGPDGSAPVSMSSSSSSKTAASSGKGSSSSAKGGESSSEGGGSSSSCAATPVGVGAGSGAILLGLGAIALMTSRRRVRK
jgi:uncharacterized membrane protein YgcG